MGAISIVLSQKLGEKLRKKAAETDSLPEELGVELLQKSLNEDPEELVEHYQALSEKYFKDAKEFLSMEDLVQASEKLWGASALAVKAVAAKRGLKLDKHGSLWEFVSRLAKERSDEDFIRLFFTANALHRNFYEGQMNKAALEIATRDIEKLIEKLRSL